VAQSHVAWIEVTGNESRTRRRDEWPLRNSRATVEFQLIANGIGATQQVIDTPANGKFVVSGISKTDLSNLLSRLASRSR